MQKKLLFIKLGGSVITDKTVEQSLKLDVIQELSGQIQEICARRPDLQLVIGHGQGSFAHFPAKKYRLIEGFVINDAKYGFAVTLDVVAQLNRIIVRELLRHKLPAVSLFPSQIALTKAGLPNTTFIDSLEAYIRTGLLPVITGDALVDLKKGCTIWSADFSLPYFARLLKKRGWEIDSVIHVTKTPGVYQDINNPEKGVIERITSANFSQYSKQLTGSHGVDVTGGMLEKVRQAVELAQDGIQTVIISDQDQNLVKLVCERELNGTQIS